MRYRVLGPLEVWHRDSQLAIGGPQQKALLAILLLNANRVVSADRLVDYLWGPGDPPPTAKTLLQGCIARLRRALRSGGDATGVQPLSTQAPGYLLRVEAGELDVLVFEDLSRVAAGVPEAERRSQLLSEALAHWRGPVLDGLDLPACREEIAYLEERRISVLEQKIEADLSQGAHADLVIELKAHVRTQPWREHLCALLIAALYSLGRQADALAAYMDLRESLIEQLGIEPSTALQELHRQILAGTPPHQLVIPVGNDPGNIVGGRIPTAIPAELPAAPTTFVGRGKDLKRLGELLAGAPATMALAVVSGMPGVGKTAFTLHWAHQIKDQFSGGQLHINLRGYGQSPRLRPIEALTRFLTAFGVPPERVPLDLEQAAALYRSELSGKRVLIVLDNAYDAEQVRPLLPATPGCLVLVTGRGQLDGLVARDGGRLFTLDVLDADEALTLLRQVVSETRVDHEPESAAELVRLCAHLPLALRITGANLIRHPRRLLADQVKTLRAGQLDALAIGHDDPSAVRAVFAQSYDTLEPHARQMFGLLSLVPGPAFGIAAAAIVAGVPLSAARTCMENLVSTHLIDEPEPDRFAFHDLLRPYGREQAHMHHDTWDPASARQRYDRWMSELADDATRILCPQLLRIATDRQSPEHHQNPESALAWLEAERSNLVALAVEAAAGDNRATAWILADSLRGYFWLRRHSLDWLIVASAGRAAAAAEGDVRALAATEFCLGMAKLCLNRHSEAIGHQTRALELCEAAEWEEGRANALGNLGVVYFELGEIETALNLHEQALLANRRICSKRGEAVNHDNLAKVHLAGGRLGQAGEHLGVALGLRNESDNAMAITLEQLGILYGRRGEFGSALNILVRAIDHYRAIGHLNGQAIALAELAVVLSQSGLREVGLQRALRGYELVEQTGDHVSKAHVLNRLASAQAELGEYVDAIANHTQALNLARQTGARMPEAEALVGLAAAHIGQGEPDRALDCAEHALAIAGGIGYHGLSGQAMAMIAAAYGGLGDADEMATHACRAHAIADQTGDELLRRQALMLLGC